jgi:hypothetical protein
MAKLVHVTRNFISFKLNFYLSEKLLSLHGKTSIIGKTSLFLAKILSFGKPSIYLWLNLYLLAKSLPFLKKFIFFRINLKIIFLT